MDKLEKVIKGLECCLPMTTRNGFGDCKQCPYDRKITLEGGVTECCHDLMADALALLKAQEPRVMALEEAQGEDFCWYEQRNFDGVLLASAVIRHLNTGHGHNQTELEFMGREDRIVRYDADYGKAWRCWTARPTDEQRRAIPWET